MTRLPRALLPPLVALLAFAAFLPALDGGFLDWDDDRNFLWNTGYRGLGPRELQWMFTATWMGHYIPITWLTFGLNHALGGMDPWGYHLGNLLLHAANTTLFFFVARRLLAVARPEGGVAVALAAAAAAALLWALHPLRVESVAWITERRDLLCGFFYLLAVLAYLRGATRRAHPHRALARGIARRLRGGPRLEGDRDDAPADPARTRRLSRSAACDLGWPALVREKLGHFALAAVGAGVASWAVTRGAGWTSYEAYGLEARLAMTGYSFWFYPWKLVWPERLSPLYELPARIRLLDAAVPLADRRRARGHRRPAARAPPGSRARSPPGFTPSSCWRR